MQYLDEVLEWDPKHTNLSPGTRILVLIINILTDRKALVNVAGFFDLYDCELIFGKGITADDFTDDALVRALDLLYQAGPAKVFNQLAFLVYQQLYGTKQLDSVHLDLTSISVSGTYDDELKENDEQQDLLHITYGYSKDHRADDKQFMYGLGVTAEGFPVIAEVLNGNTSEGKWLGSALAGLEAVYGAEGVHHLMLLADAAWVQNDNLKLVADHESGALGFVSRLHARYSLHDALKQTAWSENNWQEIGSLAKRKKAELYWSSTQYGEIDGVRYRFEVIRSSALDKRKQHTLEAKYDKERKSIEKAAKELGSVWHACEADAKAAAEKLLKTYSSSIWKLSYRIEFQEEVSFLNPGRPSASSPFTMKAGYHALVTIIAKDEERVAMQQAEASCFILITNHMDTNAWSAERLLTEYKEQQSVERGFRFLKSPFMLGPVFLHKPERVEALAMVFMMIYMLAMVMQIQVRRALAKRQENLRVGQRKLDQPTIAVLLDVFERIHVAVMPSGERIVNTSDPTIDKILTLLGFSWDLWKVPPAFKEG